MNEGIEYIEVRALDLNPYLPLGIDAEQVRFLDSFLLHCLLSDSPECNKDEFFEVANNLTLVVEQGRDPELELKREGKALQLRDWAGALVEDIEHSAALLDKSHGTSAYSNSVAAQMAKVKDSELTPSGQILKDMKEGRMSFFDFSMENSRKIRDYFRQGDLEQATVSRFIAARERSIEMQKEIEEADEISFDDYLTAWNEG
jgi:glutamate--cysteine ligase